MRRLRSIAMAGPGLLTKQAARIGARTWAQRSGNTHRELRSADRDVAHLGLEQLDTALAQALRLVHREVGVREQLVDPMRGRHAQRHAHAAACDDRPTLELHGRLERLEQPLRDRHGLARAGRPLQEHAELVAAQARDGVARPQAPPEPPRDVGAATANGLRRLSAGADPRHA